MDAHLLFRWTLALACTSVPVAGLPGQTPQAGQDGGTWWSVAAAVGGARLTCDICDPTRDGGPAVEVAFGAYAAPSLRVGMDAGAWTYKDGDFRETVWTAGVVAELHPLRERGLHLIGGVGWTGYRAGEVDAEDDEEGFHYDAVRLRVGAGWDLPLTSSWVVGNRVTLDASSLGTLHDGPAPIARSVGLSVVRLAVFLRHR